MYIHSKITSNNFEKTPEQVLKFIIYELIKERSISEKKIVDLTDKLEDIGDTLIETSDKYHRCGSESCKKISNITVSGFCEICEEWFCSECDRTAECGACYYSFCINHIQHHGCNE